MATERQLALEDALNKALAFFNPSYERPEALRAYCEAFHVLYGWYPRAWYKLNGLEVPADQLNAVQP